MKKNKLLTIITVSLLMVVVLVGCTANGNGSSLLIEDTAPTESVEGNEGDLYLDTSSYDMYKYVEGTWLKVGNITDEENAKLASVLINKDGYWVINGKVTDVKATGKDGKDGADGINGKDGKDGADGIDGKDGKDGSDGINGKDGKDGADGINGKDGKDGADGIDGNDGKSPTITISEDGLWIINGQLTNIKAGTKLICESVTEETKTTGTVASLRSDYNTNKYKPGDEYLCEVKPGTEYHFFIVSVEGSRVNLIMDANVNSDGTPTTEGITKEAAGDGIYNKTTWISDSTFGCGEDGTKCAKNTKGPIDAMQFLYNATKDWTNLDPLNYTYMDRQSHETPKEDYGYESFISNNGVLTITPLTGEGITMGTHSEPLRARMPIEEELHGEGKCKTTTENDGKFGSCPLWISNYLSNHPDVKGVGLKNITDMEGYWTLSSNSAHAENNRVWYIYYFGNIYGDGSVHASTPRGVRPVITVSKNDISTNIINN